MSMQMEELGGVLWMTGNLHPNEENAFVQRLARYLRAGTNIPRVLEMSGVGYMSTSAARALLSQAKRASGKVTIRSSVPVVRTLNAVGMPESIEVEAYREPNKKSETMSVSASAAQTSVISRPGHLAGTSTQALPRRSSRVAVHPVQESETEPVAEPSEAVTPSITLAEEDEDLQADWIVLKKLVIMRVYSFQIPGLKSEITGKVISRIGGPWILIDTHGAKKMVNIAKAASIDLLS